MRTMVKWPTMAEVEVASHLEICKWHRFLPSAMNDKTLNVQTRIWERYKSGGGFTAEVSKIIGWDYR